MGETNGVSIYERLGGEAAIMAAVDLFYKKVIADELTGPFFTALDMQAQTKKQIAFMTWAFGGPVEYRGRPLREAHAKLVQEKGLTEAHFDRVAALLGETLNELGIAPNLVQEVLQTVGTVRGEVLSK
jgi:hemoglobin